MNHYNSWAYILNHYKTVHMITKNWWAQTDLNCRPTDYESWILSIYQCLLVLISVTYIF